MQQMKIDDIDIDIVRKKIKNLYLSIRPPLGRVCIAAPKRMSDESIRLFVLSKLSWIQKRLIKFSQQVPKQPLIYVSGEGHYYQGNKYLLNVIEKQGRGKVIIRDGLMDLEVNIAATTEERQHVLNRWYRKQLKEKAAVLFNKWQSIIGVTINEFRLRQMKTRWGTCNIKAKRIWLNLELIKKTEQCLEYIVVHELVHLLERRHNTRFKNFMDQFLPHWRDARKELRNS